MGVYNSNSGICYVIEVNSVNNEFRDLTGEEIDNNFRLVYYSASLQNDGSTLRLHRDIGDVVRNSANTWEDPYNPPDTYTLPTDVRGTSGVISDYDDITLSGGGGSSLTINGSENTRILTANGSSDSITGQSSLKFDGSKLILTGSLDMTAGGTTRNILVGECAGASATTTCTVAIGFKAGQLLSGNRNTILGAEALVNAAGSSRTTAIGHCALENVTSGNFNTAIGAQAGECLTSGCCNVFIGSLAGPSSGVAIDNKLYINNAAGSPLICGDFSTGHVEIKTAISASALSGSFFGDGSNLTGLNVSAFPFNGDAVITGSLTVSGSTAVVNLVDTLAVSASTFSGSFVGDGSSLTGVTSNAFPHTGSAIVSGSFFVDGESSVTGSFIVSGSEPTISLRGVTTIDNGVKIHYPGTNSIGIGADSLGTNTAENNIAIGYRVGHCSTSNNVVAIGTSAARCSGNFTVGVGNSIFGENTGNNNTALGHSAFGAADSNGHNNTGIGFKSLLVIGCGHNNSALGALSGECIKRGTQNTAVGNCSLRTMGDGNNNTALGNQAGCKTVAGSSNVYIGYQAGPSVDNTTESNQLYINNAEGTPLIKGDFSTSQVTFSGGVSGSFSGSFEGDGTNLTGVTAEWDGSRNGDSNITGSLTVSGSTSVVDFTNVAAVSGSTFSGSFVGDGSGLTGVTGIEWDGTRNGDSNITGSLIVSGALDVGGTVTIASGSYPGGPGVELIQVNGSGLTSATTLYTFTIGGSTNYTGFKADYALTTTGEDSKKVGTVLASWNPSAGTSVVNEEYTLATGDATRTSFAVDASSNTSAIFKLNVAAGTFEINALITAFKRVV